MAPTVCAVATLGLLALTGAVNAQADGVEVYDAKCARCHNSGTMGAPLLEDPSEWPDLSEFSAADVQAQHLDDGYLRGPEDAKRGVTTQQMEEAVSYVKSTVTK